MTIYDKGLIRAMKQAYKEDGYYVAEMQWIPVEIADV